MYAYGEVSLTGSIVDTLDVKKTVSSIVPRAIRSTTSSSNVTVPKGAKGFMLSVKVFGVTGTTPSATISVYNGFGTARSPFYVGLTATTTKTNFGALWYPGAVLGEGGKGDAGNKVVGLPLGTYLEFNFTITGTFAGGEGFDTELDIIWLH